MTLRGAARALLTFLLLALDQSGADAHSLDLAKVKLERANAEVVLVEAQVSSEEDLLFPSVPVGCLLSHRSVSNGPAGDLLVRFQLSCPAGLPVNGELVFPWKARNTILFNGDGEAAAAALVRPRSLDGHRVPIATRVQPERPPSLGYLSLGVEHILIGIDHLFFVLLLMMLVPVGWPLLQAVTGFTVGHSITPALATLGLVRAPGALVEPLIALSIVMLAVEVVHRVQGRAGFSSRYPWRVAAGFGLLHGFGFAGVLAELGLPEHGLFLALLAFNLGVELGQILFMSAILLASALFSLIFSSAGSGPRALQWPRTTTGLAYGIGMVATFWVVERLAV
ncbi:MULTISPECIES: HupE/UreJ family protein [unclassified Roseibium]|uniref:HupE/UreJ family protein n=1 Tax=unclassified Roseibium TaxID=2629323 RepID=UPI00273D466A|nr:MULTISPECIES: HupE/UreJ family protein [unclassified Roseibium]